VIGLGRGQAGAVGAGRQPQVGEDGAHDSRVLDGGNDPQPAAASGTGQDIERERTRGESTPPRSRQAGRVGGGLEREADAVRGRAGVARTTYERQRARGARTP